MKATEVKYRVGHAGYVSPFTEFMDGYLAEHPEVVEDQRRGWYLFWDHKANFEDMKEASKDSVPVKGYDYF